jgi:hypothetical protein
MGMKEERAQIIQGDGRHGNPQTPAIVVAAEPVACLLVWR